MSIITREVNSIPVAQRAEDGYINLTKMAKASDKLIGHYLSNASTKEFLEALSGDIGIPISAAGKTLNDVNTPASALVHIKKGGGYTEQGTWGHPQVAIHCAQWCSPQFAVLVSKWVFEWMSKGQTPVVEVAALEAAPEEPAPPALPPSPDRLTLLKEAVEIGNQLGGFDERQRLLLKDQLMNLLMEERLLATTTTATATPASSEPVPQKQKRLEVPISDRCVALGHRPNISQLMKIGQIAASFYKTRHGHAPQKREQFVGGATRMVNVYTTDDLGIIDAAIQAVMEG